MALSVYTLGGSLPGALVILIYLVVRLIMLAKSRKLNLAKETARFILMVYIVLLISYTLFPLNIAIGNKGFLISMYQKSFFVVLNLNPFNFHGMLSTNPYVVIKNIGGNLLLMMPFSILLAFNFKSMQKWKNNMLVIILASVSIEVLQYIWQITQLDVARRSDINDIIQNVIGAAIGYILYRYVLSQVPVFQPFLVNKFRSPVKAH